MYKKGNKILASLLVFIMLMANMATAGQVIAADIGENIQNSKTNHVNVEFNSFLEDNGKLVHNTTNKIGKENKIVAQVSVKDSGYLKDARVEFVDSNFNVSNTENQDKVLSVENNVVTLNQINAGEDISIELPISFEHENKIELNEFDKTSVARFTATYVDDNGKTHNIKKDIKLDLSWTADVEASVLAEVTKYVQYDVNEQKGLILQMLVKEEITDNKLPTKESNIEIEIPEINGVKPENIEVLSLDNNFTTTKSEDETKLIITSVNAPNEQNEVAWGNGQREYEITFTFSENAITDQEVVLNQKVNANITAYSCDVQELTANYESEIILKDQIGDIINFEVETPKMQSKGYMYSNNETPYTQKVIANISMANLIDEISLSLAQDTFKIENKNYKADSYYKNIKLSKSDLVEFFSENGKIEIYSEDELIAEIDNTIEDENIIVELNADNITIKTTKPVKSGEFKFELEKALKKETNYTQKQLEKTECIDVVTNVKVTSGNLSLIEKTLENEIALVEPIMQADLSLNDNNLSTVVTNENVELRAVLKTNSEYNRLFKNPKVTIELPSYIENIDIKNIQLLFDNELVIKQFKLENNIITIETEGTQTVYNIDSVYGGANIVITADLTLDKLTPNKQDEIVMNVESEGNTIQNTATINYIAPSGVVTVNSISNYAEGQEIMALTNNESGVLEVQASPKTATAQMQVINNYDNPIDEVVILGRTLSENASNTETGANLGNNLTAPMTSEINGVENATVYYSPNSSATTDLNNEENGWTTDTQNVNDMRSYMIVLDDSLDTGDSIEFNYDMQIPANLRYSETATSMYTVYFDNVQPTQTLEDRASSRMVTLTTGEAPELEVTLGSYINENSVVRQGEYVRYIATIKNVSDVDAENVKLYATAPSSDDANHSFKTKHVEYKEEYYFTGYDEIEEETRTIEVGQIKAGEEKQVEFEIKIASVANALNSMETDLETTVQVMADKMQREVESNTYKLVLKNALLELYTRTATQRDFILTKGDSLEYIINAEPKTNLNHTVIVAQIPEGLTIKNVKVENTAFIVGTDGINELNYNKQINNNVVTISIDNLTTADTVRCTIETEVATALGSVSPTITATADNEIHNSNTVINTIEELTMTVRQNSLENPYIKEKEQFAFEYVVTNTSNTFCKDFNFEANIPDGAKLVEIQSVTNGRVLKVDNISEDENKVKINNSLIRPGQVVIYKLIMEAETLQSGETQKEITSKAKIYGNNFEEQNSNEVTVTVEYSKDAHMFDSLNDGNTDTPSNPVNPVDPNKKTISGLAWIDKNKDGQRDDDEELLSAIEVRLLSKATSNVLKTVKTSSKGEYEFNNLDEGEYLVVVIYDTYKYDITDYKKSNVNQSLNSDFINVTMNINDEDKKVAITDTIKLTDSNARNIDIGLFESPKSKLKLDKYISQVTVTYGNTVKTYDYDNAQLVKAEIPASELSNATVIVEYKIVVTNVGAIGNYIKKVVDYIPSGMKFNSELNRDWYQSTNGDLYNSSLANTKLLPGQSAELTLTLTKKMTDTNTGIVNNNAEIYEVYNEEGIIDQESTNANKVIKEDDMSAADLVIGVKTGDAVIYSIIIATVIATIMGIGIYYIRKIVLRNM